jgi:ubiquinone/menaquinone biosynthesis C-methylase UbiE
LKHQGNTYILLYDPLDQQINFEGVLRPHKESEVQNIQNFLVKVHAVVNGTLKLSFRKLRFINSVAYKALIDYILYIRSSDKPIPIKIIGSDVINWEKKILPNLRNVWADKVEFSIYDQDFYGSQGVVEASNFIPVLRNQTRILWQVEKAILEKHGCKPNLKIADICCGCGDVALLIAKELEPNFVLGLDHSKASIDYARALQKEQGIVNAEFCLGDASAILLEDDSFDFVICRLSLQIFDKPQEIIGELYRITKPGGRVYLTCEDLSLIVSYPNEKEVAEHYDRVIELCNRLNMDFMSGRKLYSLLKNFKVKDIKVDHIVVDTNNSDRESFSKVVESWKFFCCESVADTVKLSEEERQTLVKGFDTHLRTIRHPDGYTNWTMIAVSGEK